VESGGLLFDVDVEGDELVANERRDLVIAVRFGFQPNATPSGGCRAEVDEKRLFRLRGLAQC
jgi:hypothetical protein